MCRPIPKVLFRKVRKKNNQVSPSNKGFATTEIQPIYLERSEPVAPGENDCDEIEDNVPDQPTSVNYHHYSEPTGKQLVTKKCLLFFRKC